MCIYSVQLLEDVVLEGGGLFAEVEMVDRRMFCFIY